MAESKREHSRFAMIFAGGTLISRVLGLVRDMVILNVIPVSIRDAFLVAWKFPNMLRELIGEGATNAAFVPVLSQVHERESEDAFRAAIRALMGTMLLILTVMTVIGVVAVPWLLRQHAALEPLLGKTSLTATDVKHTVFMARWIFPYLLFIGMSAFAMAPLLVLKHYTTPSWAPALLNVSLILCCWLLRDKFADPAYALIVGVWFGGLAQLAANYIALGRRSGVWKPSFSMRHPAVKASFLLLIPVLFGQATSEVNKLVDTMFAYKLGGGTVTILYAANRLVQLPLSMFGMAVAVAILPSIARSGAQNNTGEMRATMMSGLRQCFFLVFPAMLGLIVLRRPIIELLFDWGGFGVKEIEQTTTALLYYGAGLLSFAWVKVVVAGFYANHDTKTPVIIASASMALNIVLNILLVEPLGFRGLALATTISFTVNFLLLYSLLSARIGNLWDHDFWMGLGRLTLAAVMMALFSYGLYQGLSRLITANVFIPLTATLAAALAIYFWLCKIFNATELEDTISAFRRRG